MRFKQGDKVKFLNNTDYADTDMTLNKVYTVLRDQGRSENCIRIITDDGAEYGLYAFRFELVKDDKPTLKPGMRVVLQAGYDGVVVRNSRDELAISLGNGGWSAVYLNETGHFSREYNIVEVYEAPNFWDAKDPTARGALVWKADDKAAERKAADDAVAAAEAALAKAQEELEAASATRAAL